MRGRRAFTLVELLVVIAIIGILIALLLPAVQAARESARRSKCTNNLKQLGVSLHNYHDVHHQLPFASGYWQAGNRTGTWAAFVLPYLEEQSTYDLFDFHQPLTAAANQRAVTTSIPSFICPSDPLGEQPVLTKRGETGWSNPTNVIGLWYVGSMGPTQPDECYFCPDPNSSPNNWCCQGFNFGTQGPPNNSVGMFGRYPKGFRFRDVQDGLSKTWMLGETLPGDCVWNGAYNNNFTCNPTTIPLNTMQSDNGQPVWANWARACGFKSLHAGGAHFALGDGSVRFISEEIDFRLYNNLGTRAGGEIADVPN